MTQPFIRPPLSDWLAKTESYAFSDDLVQCMGFRPQIDVILIDPNTERRPVMFLL